MTFWHFLSLIAVAILVYVTSPFLLMLPVIYKLYKLPEYVQKVVWEEVESAIENVKVRAKDLRAQSEQGSAAETENEEELLNEGNTETIHN